MSTRTELAAARIRLRNAQDTHDKTKREIEQLIVDTAGGPKALGSNEEERKRALELRLHETPRYTAVLERLRNVQAAVDRLQAQLEDQIDARRTEDRKSRDRLSTALECLVLGRNKRPYDEIVAEAAELFK